MIDNNIYKIKIYENEKKEFKKEFNNLTKPGIQNTIKAFLNCDGGEIFIGVQDDGTIIQIDDNQHDEISQWISNSFSKYNDHIILKYDKTRNIFIINISPSNNIFYENDGKVYVRKQATSKKIIGKELEEHIKRRFISNLEYIDKVLKTNFNFEYPVNFIYENEYLSPQIMEKFNNFVKKNVKF